MSILAHSLGSVLCYDLLCNQEPDVPQTGLADDTFAVDSLLGMTRPAAALDPQLSVSSLKPLSSTDLDPTRTSQANSLLLGS